MKRKVIRKDWDNREGIFEIQKRKVELKDFYIVDGMWVLFHKTGVIEYLPIDKNHYLAKLNK
jgi:hypothetical protein